MPVELVRQALAKKRIGSLQITIPDKKAGKLDRQSGGQIKPLQIASAPPCLFRMAEIFSHQGNIQLDIVRQGVDVASGHPPCFNELRDACITLPVGSMCPGCNDASNILRSRIFGNHVCQNQCCGPVLVANGKGCAGFARKWH